MSAGVHGRVASIQLLRFVAATMVVFHHSISLARGYVGDGGILAGARLFDLGGIGVDIFFVISGLVITLSGPLANRRPTAAEFYLRRWVRIAPLFYILTIPILLTWWIRTPVSPLGAGYPISLSRWAATLCFWPSAGQQNVPPLLSNGWTLCFEMFFYSVMAVVLIGGRVRLMAGVVISAVVAVTFLRSRFDIPALQFMDNKISLEFCMGVVLALFKREIATLGPRLGWTLLVAGTIWLVLWGLGLGPGIAGYDQVMADDGVIVRVIVIGVPAALIVAGCIAVDSGISRHREMFDRIGDASYAIFLSHGLTLTFLFVLLTTLNLAIPPSAIILGAVPICVWLGYCVYRAIDRPIMDFFRPRLLRGAPRPSLAVAME